MPAIQELDPWIRHPTLPSHSDALMLPAVPANAGSDVRRRAAMFQVGTRLERWALGSDPVRGLTHSCGPTSVRSIGSSPRVTLTRGLPSHARHPQGETLEGVVSARWRGQTLTLLSTARAREARRRELTSSSHVRLIHMRRWIKAETWTAPAPASHRTAHSLLTGANFSSQRP